MRTLLIGTAITAVIACGCTGNQAQKANGPVPEETAAVEQPAINQLTAQEQNYKRMERRPHGAFP